MLKQLTLPSAKIKIHGAYYGLYKIILMYTYIGENNARNMSLGMFKTIIELYLLNVYDETIDWSMIDRNKLMDELLTNILVNRSNIVENDLYNIMACLDKEIYFNYSDEYNEFLNDLMEQLNNVVPVLCKIGAYEKI